MIKFKNNKAPEITNTKEQLSVLNTTNNCVLVDAVPGSGKSTLLRQIAYNNPECKILYLAYNKAIIESIKLGVPDNCDVSTFHAFGLKVLRDNGKTGKVNFNKHRNIDGTYGVADLVAKHMLLAGGASDEQWKKTCDVFHIPLSLIKKAKTVFDIALDREDISAEDMISMPMTSGCNFPSYDIVLIDEYQDMSMDKILLCSQIKTERIFFVGDVKQKINQYAGSSATIEKDLMKIYPTLEVLNIMESFRCPEQVLNVAKEYVPSIGGSKQGGKVTYGAPDKYPDESLIICRTNAPLLRVATKFIKENKRFRIKPSVITSINKETNYLLKSTNSLTDAKYECDAKQSEEIKRFTINGWNPTIALYKYDAVREVLNSGRNKEEVQRMMRLLKDRCDMNGGHLLSTAHSSKGLENENVFILDINQCKNIANKSNQTWAKESETNCEYVMTTRSLENLTFITSNDIK